MKIEIRDKCKGSNNGFDWFQGALEKEIDFFAPFGIKRDGTGEVRYFVHAIPADYEPCEGCHSSPSDCKGPRKCAEYEERLNG